MDDEFLIQQTLAGNRQAFRLVVLRYERPLFRFLGLLGFRGARAEDVAQETFLRAFKALGSFDPARAAFSTWLFTIARRLAIGEWQRARHEEKVPAVCEEALSLAPDPAQSALLAERARRVENALQALPAQPRSTFFFSQIKELTLEEVAELEGCAVGTVKSRIFGAREQLRLAFAEDETCWPAWTVPVADVKGVARQVWFSRSPRDGVRWSRLGKVLG
ncbi:MAG TPA: sigma-70 family RNA polymerase sigma factor [Polyangiaceae bacterium]|nr:sigma-70 family RNA polymerase sigma factor [Polyangiaceae bacterium]